MYVGVIANAAKPGESVNGNTVYTTMISGLNASTANSPLVKAISMYENRRSIALSLCDFPAKETTVSCKAYDELLN
jgi:hypothetical protein